MPLSWNEIKTRALAFAKEWEHESSEDAEAKIYVLTDDSAVRLRQVKTPAAALGLSEWGEKAQLSVQ